MFICSIPTVFIGSGVHVINHLSTCPVGILFMYSLFYVWAFVLLVFDFSLLYTFVLHVGIGHFVSPCFRLQCHRTFQSRGNTERRSESNPGPHCRVVNGVLSNGLQARQWRHHMLHDEGLVANIAFLLHTHNVVRT